MYREGEIPDFVRDPELRPRWIAFKSVRALPAGANISMLFMSFFNMLILIFLN